MQKDMADELLDTADIFEINKLTVEELLSEEKENLDISSTIDTIQGLLIDIYK